MVAEWLSDSGCRPDVTTSYRAGKDHLEQGPMMVISQLKLGAYNGLHLALRALAKGIPTVVFGEANAATQREAEQIGAAYVDSSSLQKDKLQSLIRGCVMPSRGLIPRPSSILRASFGSAGTARGTDTCGEN
jgi:hypothetical protein